MALGLYSEQYSPVRRLRSVSKLILFQLAAITSSYNKD